jgi:hypothetical protein
MHYYLLKDLRCWVVCKLYYCARIKMKEIKKTVEKNDYL